MSLHLAQAFIRTPTLKLRDIASESHQEDYYRGRSEPSGSSAMSELSPSAGFQLAVTCECAFGEMVVAVGGCALLGSWNARQGLVLEWTPGHIWKGTIEKVSLLHLSAVEL